MVLAGTAAGGFFAMWGAELPDGEGPGRVRSREPLRVTGEITDWQGHSPEALKAVKDSLARLDQLGIQPMDDGTKTTTSYRVLPCRMPIAVSRMGSRICAASSGLIHTVVSGARPMPW